MSIPPLIRWEYFVARLTDYNWAAQMMELSHLGNDGWELVAMLDGVAYLKRPMIEAVSNAGYDPESDDPRLAGRQV